MLGNGNTGVGWIGGGKVVVGLRFNGVQVTVKSDHLLLSIQPLDHLWEWVALV